MTRICSIVNVYLQNGCPFQYSFTGEFNFRSYQLVIAVGVLAFLQNIAHLTYYVLPVDSNRQKYLPGIAHYVVVGCYYSREFVCVATSPCIIITIVCLCCTIITILLRKCIFSSGC